MKHIILIGGFDFDNKAYVMRRLAVAFLVGLCCAFVWAVSSNAQGRGGQDWTTSNGDAQRSSWVRTDAKISKESVQKPGFQFLWKIKLKNEAKQLNSLTPPSTLERLIGYRGFRMLGFVGGSSDNIFTIDADLGRIEWEKRLASTAPVEAGTLTCPGGMTTGVARPSVAAFPVSGGAGPGSGFGRSTPAKSSVGKPGQGATTLALVRPNPQSPSSGPAPGAAPRPNPANPPGGPFGRGPSLIYAIASDGMLHTLHLSNGAASEPPIKFLPPNANANGLIVINQIAYVVTQGNCGGVANGLWALDLVSKQVATWKANVSGLAGAAFGADGTIYVATGSGGESPNSLVALDPKTLSVKGSYSAGGQEFSATPVVFEYRGKTLIAAPTKNGQVHLLDSAGMSARGGAALSTTPASAKAGDFTPGALASWQDAGGTRWILAPAVGSQAVDAGFKSAATEGAIVAWKVVEQNGAPTLRPGWASRNLVSPLPPTIINGVVFVTSGGEFRAGDSDVTAEQRARRSSNAVLYALDGATGNELWNSGATITSFTRGGALSGGMGQIYLTTHDGVIYAFGFLMEH